MPSIPKKYLVYFCNEGVGKVVFLLDKEQALQQFSQQMQYWGIEEEKVEQVFSLALLNSHIDIDKVALHLNLQQPLEFNALQSIYVFQVGEHFFVHSIYSELVRLGELKFLQESENVFLRYPLQRISELYRWLQMYITVAKKHFGAAETSEELHLLVQQLEQSQPKTSKLKMCAIVELLYRFTEGEAHYSYILRKIAFMKTHWKRGKWGLTTTENTLFAYMAMTIAHARGQWKKVIDEARFLLKQDRFMDVAVELIIEYGGIMKTVQPQPAALIKNYRASVFENFFFMYIEALVQLKLYKETLRLLKTYEIATTTTIFEYLHRPSEEQLIAIEAAVQQNIALLMDGSVSYVKQSLEKWQGDYGKLEEARISSQYMCYLLETLFVCEQYELFERLMAIYTKYVKLDEHYERLKEHLTKHLHLHEV